VATPATEAETLEERFRRSVESQPEAWFGAGAARAAHLGFALGRLDEGRRLEGLLRARLGAGRLRVLDLGAGNGGVSLGLAAAAADLEVTALDLVVNPVLREMRQDIGQARALRRAGGPRVRQLAGRGEALPFRPGVFDALVCLDSFEHFARPETIGHEILRVLRPGGACVLSTPARLKYLFRPDPHQGLRGLLLLPDALQRLLVDRWLRRRPPYDVHHTYWHLGELLAQFPGRGRVEVFWDRAFPGTHWLRDRFWYKYRYFLWDKVLIFKAEPGDPADSWAEMPSPLAEIAGWDGGPA
jgi:SAM-dependent methyltransferase